MTGEVVRIVLEGHLVRDGARVVDASSTVTLVEAAGMKILVDSGKASERKALLRSISGLGVDPDDINIVVNTHLHADHCGGNDLFASAKVYAHAAENPPAGSIRVAQEMVLARNVALVPTPGHTLGCLSVFVRADRKYAIAGDALPTKENYDAHAPPSVNVDPRLALRSMDAIVAFADVVVPGHGGPFEVLGKK
ncbi:MAG: hypothetical protein A3K67_02475 [Euryarchaeota archaeon RBG_16_62_10]|nr:MAG: hypothetical protein A3K67_02475 [Euryarchaeota archaeon RBG_16_62_10]